METSRDKYFNYILEHKRNVKRAWSELNERLKLESEYELSIDEFKNIYDSVSEHDKSKMDKEEFNAYMNYFYPEKPEDKNLEKFNIAWLMHQNKNRHHWHFWVLIDDGKAIPLEMTIESVIEMLLDWKAMSYKFNDTVASYYEKNKHKMMLHEKTVDKLEKWMKLL